MVIFILGIPRAPLAGPLAVSGPPGPPPRATAHWQSPRRKLPVGKLHAKLESLMISFHWREKARKGEVIDRQLFTFVHGKAA